MLSLQLASLALVGGGFIRLAGWMAACWITRSMRLYHDDAELAMLGRPARSLISAALVGRASRRGPEAASSHCGRFIIGTERIIRHLILGLFCCALDPRRASPSLEPRCAIKSLLHSSRFVGLQRGRAVHEASVDREAAAEEAVQPQQQQQQQNDNNRDENNPHLN